MSLLSKVKTQGLYVCPLTILNAEVCELERLGKEVRKYLLWVTREDVSHCTLITINNSRSGFLQVDSNPLFSGCGVGAGIVYGCWILKYWAQRSTQLLLLSSRRGCQLMGPIASNLKPKMDARSCYRANSNAVLPLNPCLICCSSQNVTHPTPQLKVWFTGVP